MRTLIFLVSFFIVGHLLAQAPGYMGKKLSAMYEPHLSFSIYDDFGKSKENGIPAFGMNLRHDLYVDYVISRGTTLGMTFKFMNARMYDVKEVLEEVYVPAEDRYENVGFNGDLNDRIVCVGITAKNFSYRKRGSIAPVGKYKSFELLATFQKLVERKLVDYGNEIYEDVTPEPAFATLMHFDEIPANDEIDISPTAAFIFGFGRQSVYNKGLTANFGWEIGLSLSQYMFDCVAQRAHYTLDAYHPASEAEDMAGGRFAGAILLSFNMGIGYILM